MRYLIVTPQMGFTPSGSIIAGGLQQFSRCLVRALASSPSINRLGIWSQVDKPETNQFVRKMVQVHAHNKISLDVKGFGGNRIMLALGIIQVNLQRSYDHIIYLLVNQSLLALLPGKLPYTVWEVGAELFQPISYLKSLALCRADSLLSISENTTTLATQNNPGLPKAKVVHLCVEPKLFEPDSQEDSLEKDLFVFAQKKPIVLIVGSMFRYKETFYKGHKELIAGWPEVVNCCPEAELWIVGDGDGREDLELEAKKLPTIAANKVHFLGLLSEEALKECYRQCRVFAMPSTREGFGLVFVEAARNGIPSIGGKHDSVKEIVLDGQTGILVEQDPHEIAQACVQLLTDNDLAHRLGIGARKRYLEYFRFQHFRERLLMTMNLEQ